MIRKVAIAVVTSSAIVQDLCTSPAFIAGVLAALAYASR